MDIAFLKQTFEENENKDAIVWNDSVFSYGWLLDRVIYWGKALQEKNVEQGTVALLEADFSPNAVALFLALIQGGCIVVPMSSS